ncbi:MAG TPA: beta-ketoacyl-ACP synthase III [Opitutaceae bacterium]|nr:beta-ketoacyl-ACP synthase III [Opitutaceae bacterium]
MATPSIAFLGTGSYTPTRILSNQEISQLVETSDEWILTRTGIRERRIAAGTETTADMAAAAGKAALESAGLSPGDIDLVILATLTPDLPMPATACLVQQRLGIPSRAACFDVNAACTGFLYALDTAWGMLSSGRYRHALVIGAEKLSTVLDWKDRTTCVLFGDAAGAAVLGPARRESSGLIGTRLGSLPLPADLLWVPGGGSSPANLDDPRVIRMKGKEVFKVAVRAMEDVARDILEQHHVSADQIACVVPHQANLRIIEAIAHYLKLPMDRFYVNVDRYGNTSAASVPLALHEAQQAGRIRPGDLVLLVAFGAGLTYGGALVRW